MSPIQAAAQALHDKGYVVIPVMLTEKDGKKSPMFPRGWQQASHSRCMTLFKETPHNSIAIKTGTDSDLFVMDFDVLKSQESSDDILDGMAVRERWFGDANDYPSAETANAGRHMFFSLSKSVSAGLNLTRNTTKLFVDGKRTSIDIRGEGGCVFVAPSTYANKSYRWMTEVPHAKDLLSCPPWLVEVINNSASKKRKHQPEAIPTDNTKQKPHGGVVMYLRPAAWDSCVPVLEKAGFCNPRLLRSPPSKPDSLVFQCDAKGKDCPCCGCTHDKNNWYISQMSDGRYSVANFSGRCRRLVIDGQGQVCAPEVEEIVVRDVITAHNEMAETFQHWGLTAPMQATTDEQGKPCWFIEQHIRHCPSCSKCHISDRWMLEVLVEACYTLRNSEACCRPRGMILQIAPGVLRFGNKFVDQILDSPQSDTPFARLFLAERGKQIISDGSALFRYETSVWKKLADNVVVLAMQQFFEELIGALLQLVQIEEHKMSFHSKDIAQLRKELMRASSHTRTQTGANNFIKSLKIQAFVDKLHEQFDSNPDLIAFEDGVLDISSGRFRQGELSDMLSKSTGYHFGEEDAAYNAEVEDFMTKLYPVEEERNVAQLFGGYCLYGRHPDKVLLMLTDDGGDRSGHNGKTSFAKAVQAALGPHAVKGKNSFLYKAEFNSETANSHNAGELFYLGKRMAFWEELDPTRRLADGKLKDLNGGCPSYNFRGCNMKEEFQAEWGCKMVMCFNRSNMPQLDFTDGPLVDRLLVLKHRSRFIMSADSYEQQKHIPNTFAAVVDIADKLVLWRPSLMRWLLQGHLRWRQIGFTQLPEQCRKFTEDLVGEQDTVKAFVEDSIQFSGQATDFVTRSRLWTLYKSEHPEENNKKTALGKQRWWARLQQLMPAQNFYSDKKIGGKKYRDLYLQHCYAVQSSTFDVE
eukprot:jgi/Astpho2/5780/fgenesh1_pg.00080_%23_41_t